MWPAKWTRLLRESLELIMDWGGGGDGRTREWGGRGGGGALYELDLRYPVAIATTPPPHVLSRWWLWLRWWRRWLSFTPSSSSSSSSLSQTALVFWSDVVKVVVVVPLVVEWADRRSGIVDGFRSMDRVPLSVGWLSITDGKWKTWKESEESMGGEGGGGRVKTCCWTASQWRQLQSPLLPIAADEDFLENTAQPKSSVEAEVSGDDCRRQLLQQSIEEINQP